MSDIDRNKTRLTTESLYVSSLYTRAPNGERITVYSGLDIVNPFNEVGLSVAGTTHFDNFTCDNGVVDGNVQINGAVSINVLYADGTNITGLPGSSNPLWKKQVNGDIYFADPAAVGIGLVNPDHSKALDVSGDVHIQGRLILDGNIQIAGTLDQVSATDLHVIDRFVVISKDNLTDQVASGIAAQYSYNGVTPQYSALVRDTVNGTWWLLKDLLSVPDLSFTGAPDNQKADLIIGDLRTHQIKAQNDLSVSGHTWLSNVDISQNLTVYGDALILGNFNINAPIYAFDNLSVTGTITTQQTVSAQGSIYTSNALSVNANTVLSQSLSIGSSAFVQDSLSIQNLLTVTGSLSIHQSEYVDGQLSVQGPTFLSSDLSVQQTVFSTQVSASGRATLGLLSVFGSATLSNTLSVLGVSQLHTTQITGNLSVSDLVSIGGSTYIQNTLSVSGVSQLASTNISGNLSVSSSVSIGGSTNINNTLSVFGISQLSSTQISGNLNVSAITSIGGSTIVNNSLSVSGLTQFNTTQVSGSLSVSSSASIGGPTMISNTLSVLGIATLSNAVSVGGLTTVTNAVSVSGLVAIKNVLSVQGVTTLSSDLSVNSSITSASLSVSGLLNSKRLNVQFETMLGTDISIGGTITGSSTLSVFGQTTTNRLNVQLDTVTNSISVAQLTTTQTLSVSSVFLGNVITQTQVLSNYLSIQGLTVMSSQLSVNQLAVLSNDLSVQGIVTVKGSASVASTLVANLTSLSSTTIGSYLSVNNAVTLTSTLSVNNTTLLHSTNIVGDVSVSGLVSINGSTTINNSLSVASITQLNNTNISGSLSVSGLASINGLTVISNSLSVLGSTKLSDAYLSGGLSVYGLTKIDGASLINNSLSVVGTTQLSTTLINGSLSVSGSASIGGASFINSTLSVSGLTQLKNTLVSGSLSVSGYTSIGGALFVNSTLSVSGLTQLNHTLITGDLSVSGSASIGGFAIVKNALSVYGLTQLNNVYVSGSLSVSGSTSIGGQMVVNSSLSVSSLAQLGSVNVAGGISVYGSVSINGLTAISNGLSVSGPSHFFSARLSNLVSVAGSTYYRGVTVIENALSVSSTTQLSDTNVSGNLSVSGLVSVNGDIWINNQLKVTGPVLLNNVVSVKGVLLVNNQLSVSSLATLASVAVNGTMSLGSQVYVSNQLSVSGQTNLGVTLISGITSAASFVYYDNQLAVTGQTTLASTLISGITLINNQLSVNNLTTLGATNITGNTSVSSLVILNNQLSVSNTITFRGQTIISNQLSVNSQTTLSNTNITGTVSVYGSVSINGLTVMNNALSVSSFLIAPSASISGQVTAGLLSVNSTTLNTLSVSSLVVSSVDSGTALFRSQVSISDTLTSAKAAISTSISVNGFTALLGSTVISNTLSVSQPITTSALNSNQWSSNVIVRRVVVSTTGLTSMTFDSNVTSVQFKAWGAGGDAGYQMPNYIRSFQGYTSRSGYGGGGGYASSTLTNVAGKTIFLNVGAKSFIFASAGGSKDAEQADYCRGGNGGGASFVFFYDSSLNLYNIICVAGGGAGGGSLALSVSGSRANGGAAGQAGSYVGASIAVGQPGSNGLGGSGINSGLNFNSTVSTVTTIHGLGGQGESNGPPAASGAGGQGYGGGGSGTSAGYAVSGGGGGGSFGTISYNGSGTTPGNSSDSDLLPGWAIGGTPVTSLTNTVRGQGGDGLIVMYITYLPTPVVTISPYFELQANAPLSVSGLIYTNVISVNSYIYGYGLSVGGITTLNNKLSVNSTVIVNNSISASGYIYGDGSQLTNIVQAWKQSGNDIYFNTGKLALGKVSAATTVDISGDVTISNQLSVTGVISNGVSVNTLNINGIAMNQVNNALSLNAPIYDPSGFVVYDRVYANYETSSSFIYGDPTTINIPLPDGYVSGFETGFSISIQVMSMEPSFQYYVGVIDNYNNYIFDLPNILSDISTNTTFYSLTESSFPLFISIDTIGYNFDYINATVQLFYIKPSSFSLQNGGIVSNRTNLTYKTDASGYDHIFKSSNTELLRIKGTDAVLANNLSVNSLVSHQLSVAGQAYIGNLSVGAPAYLSGSSNGGSSISLPDTLLSLQKPGITGQSNDTVATLDLSKYDTGYKGATQLDLVVKSDSSSNYTNSSSNYVTMTGTTGSVAYNTIGTISKPTDFGLGSTLQSVAGSFSCYGKAFRKAGDSSNITFINNTTNTCFVSGITGEVAYTTIGTIVRPSNYFSYSASTNISMSITYYGTMSYFFPYPYYDYSYATASLQILDASNNLIFNEDIINGYNIDYPGITTNFNANVASIGYNSFPLTVRLRNYISYSGNSQTFYFYDSAFTLNHTFVSIPAALADANLQILDSANNILADQILFSGIDSSSATITSMYTMPNNVGVNSFPLTVRQKIMATYATQSTTFYYYLTYLSYNLAYKNQNKISIRDNGNIGIGTTAPTATLDVSGTTKISGTFISPSISLGSIISQTLSLSGAAILANVLSVGGKLYGDGSQLTGISSGVGSQWTNIGGGGVYYASGNVGIGTTTPGVTLDIGGAGAQFRVRGNALISGATTINNQLSVSNLTTLRNANISDNVSVGGPTIINNQLSVSGQTTLINLGMNSISIGGTISVGNVASFRGITLIGNQLSVSSLTTLANTNVIGTLSISGSASVSNVLYVGGMTVINNQLSISNTVTLNTTQIAGNLSVSNQLSVGGNVLINGQTLLKDTFVSGNTSVSGILYVANQLSISNMAILGSTRIVGTLSVSSDVSIGGNIFNNGIHRINNQLSVFNTTTLQTTQINGNLSVSGQVSIGGNTMVQGTLSVAGKLYGDGSMLTNISGGGGGGISNVIPNTLSVQLNGYFSNALSVGGVGTYANALNVSGITTINNQLSVNGVVTFTTNNVSRMTIDGSGTITGQSFAEGISSGTASTTSYTIDCTLANNFPITLTSNVTSLSIIRVPTVFTLNLYIIQGGAGNFTISWPGSVSWGFTGTPTLSTSVNLTDIITLNTYNGGSKWFGFLSGKGF